MRERTVGDAHLAERLGLPDAHFYHLNLELLKGFHGVGGVNGQNYETFKEQLKEHIDAGGTLVLDLSQIDYMTPYVMEDLLNL
jgi:hypothetical protein